LAENTAENSSIASTESFSQRAYRRTEEVATSGRDDKLIVGDNRRHGEFAIPDRRAQYDAAALPPSSGDRGSGVPQESQN
jgi:hypothetical protein